MTQPDTVENRHEKWETALAASNWWSRLPEDVRAEIAASLIRKAFKPGEALYAQGEAPVGLFGILDGTMHTVGLAPDGRQALLSVLRKGEWSGFVGIIDSKPNSFSAVASTRVETAMLPMAAAIRIFTKSPDRLNLVIHPLLQILRFSYHFITETNMRAPRRVVAQRLLDLSRSVYTPDGEMASDMDSVSQDDLAVATYLTRPTVNRTLQKLASEGLVRLGYGRIEILDIPALRAISTEIGRKQTPSRSPPARVISETLPSSARKPTPERINEILMSGRWFPALPQDLRDAILPRLKLRRYENGEFLYEQNGPGEALYVMLFGQARSVGYGSDGTRSLLSLLHPGEWTGFMHVFDDLTQPTACVASRSSIVALLPTNDARELFGRSPELWHLLARPPIGTLRQVYDFLIDTNGRPPAQLVAQRLYDLARVPWLNRDEPREFLENISQADIAEATRLSRPSVNKVMGELAREGIVEIGYGRIRILDPDRLLAFAVGRSP